jgi:hypothetical protein
MNILWIKDDITGHLNKVRGVLRALAARRDLVISEHNLAWRWSPVRQVLPWLGNTAFTLPLNCFLKSLPDPAGIDLVISAGGATQWPNAALARAMGRPNIFLGSLRRMDTEHFTLVASHDAPLDQPGFHRFDLIPSMITPDGARNAAEAAGITAGQDWGLLVGGNGEGLCWETGDYHSLVDRFIGQAGAAGRMIRIATSRRTPIAIERKIKHLAEESGILSGASWFHEPDAHTLPLIATMGACSRLCVTADSMSMTHESVSSGRPVIAVQPEQSASPRLTSNLKRLEERGHITVQTPAGLAVGDGRPDCGWNLISGDPSAPVADAVLTALARQSSNHP